VFRRETEALAVDREAVLERLIERRFAEQLHGVVFANGGRLPGDAEILAMARQAAEAYRDKPADVGLAAARLVAS
jgi:hypothetical protein